MSAIPARRRVRGAALALATALVASLAMSITPTVAHAAETVVEVDDATTTGDPRFDYSAGWAAEGGLPAAWFGGTEHVTGVTGANARLTFTGTRAQLYGNLHPNHGIYNVQVDDDPATLTRVDAYGPAMTHGQLLFDTGNLPAGTHTVSLTITGEKNPAATGTAGQIDFARVTAAPAPPAQPAAWSALPQPGKQELTGGSAWTPTDALRIFVPRDQRDALLREAERLSAELAAVLGRTAPPIVIGNDDQTGAGDIVLRTGSIAGTASEEAFSIATTDRVVVTGATDEGVFRGTRQVLQNLEATEAVPAGSVTSSPAAAERGFHLDLARKFYPAEWIKQELRDQAYVGANSFQFHFSENEGFRVESELFPQVVSSEHLTKAEVREIVALAEDLHIDVVPALNMPGHLDQVLKSFPELQLRDSSGQPVKGALDLTQPAAYDLAFALVDEYVELFPNSTRWTIGADEFIDFENIGLYPTLQQEAERRWGAGASGFDLLTDFANQVAARVADDGFTSRVWNDGMFRGTKVSLDSDIEINWWTNWASGMVPVKTALDAGHKILNYNDSQLYYVLRNGAGYQYPTAARMWEANWNSGVFPRLPANNAAGQTELNQVIPAPYSEQLLGSSFAVWSDRPAPGTPDETVTEVSDRMREGVRSHAERSWNVGSTLTLAEFRGIEDAIERAPGIVTALGAPGSVTDLDPTVQPPVVDPPVVNPPVVNPPVVNPPVVNPPVAEVPGVTVPRPGNPSGKGQRLPATGSEAVPVMLLAAGALGAVAAGIILVARGRARRSL